MNVSINPLLIIVITLTLTGCSITGKEEVTPQEITPLSKKPTAIKKPSPLDICKPNPGSPFSYRKAILVSGTTIVNDVARDLPGISTLTTGRLQTHLEELKRFYVLAAPQVIFKSGGDDTAERIRQMGQEYASQFVVKLEIQDLTLHSPEGFFNELMEEKRRDALIKLFIYDSEHGVPFYSQQFKASVSGDVVGYPGNGSTITTSWFNTDLGIKINEILKEMSTQINEQLACVPFATQVIAVRGDDIHINAGFLHGIRPGESLRVYHRSEVRIGNENQKLEQRGGWIQLNSVFPNKSIAIDKDSNAVTTGDILRAW